MHGERIQTSLATIYVYVIDRFLIAGLARLGYTNAPGVPQFPFPGPQMNKMRSMTSVHGLKNWFPIWA